MSRLSRRLALALSLAASVLLGAAAPASAANPSLSDDFRRIMEWMSQELAQGIAFNAGSTFDPPQEVVGAQLLPDITVGIGSMPLDKSIFPEIQAQQLRDMDAVNIFPKRVLFPNLTVHLRAGLPGRFDASVRASNMTTPSGYKISPGTTGKGQSNSIGVGVRKHFFGQGEDLLVTFGANYNHVLGGFTFHTPFKVSSLLGFSAESDVVGNLDWNVNSFGLNTVLSKTYGRWIPFVGAGYNYATGSVHARLEVNANTPVIAPIAGSSSRKPEPDQARAIMGLAWNAPWISIFSNGEVKVLGEHSAESWIVQMGFVMPFRIGWKSKKGAPQERERERAPRPVERVESYQLPDEPEKPAAPAKPVVRPRPAVEPEAGSEPAARPAPARRPPARKKPAVRPKTPPQSEAEPPAWPEPEPQAAPKPRRKGKLKSKPKLAPPPAAEEEIQ